MPRRGFAPGHPSCPAAYNGDAVLSRGMLGIRVPAEPDCMDIEIVEHEPPYRVGVIVGSLSRESINRRLAMALQRLAPREFEFFEIAYGDLPLYNRDLDADYPQVALDFKEAVRSADAVLFVTPEYNRSLPGALKNAIDWGSRPWGQNVWDDKPTGVIGASAGQIGTAVGQQSLRSTLSFLNARQMTTPEAYIHFTPGLIEADGEVTVPETEQFLRLFMEKFLEYTARVLTVIPRA
jgi:chromate reductase